MSVSDILKDYYTPMAMDALNKQNILMGMLAEGMARKRVEREQYLATLTPHARKVLHTQERIERLETRFAAALDFRRDDEW